jgi:hypothetical protein
MKLTHHLTAACLLLVGSSAAAPPGDSEFLRITPDEVHRQQPRRLRPHGTTRRSESPVNKQLQWTVIRHRAPSRS